MANKLGNTAGNIGNMGLVTTNDGWIYYMGVFKVRDDGQSEFTVINDDSKGPQGMYLNVAGDWLYYMSVDGGHLCRVRTDRDFEGNNWKEPEKLNRDHSENIIVAGDWVYYTNKNNGDKLHRIRIDGSSYQLLNNDSSGFINLVGDWIYYVSFDDSGRNRAGRVYRMREDGSSREKIGADDACYLNVIDDWVYYGNASKGHTLWKMRLNGSDNHMLLNGEQGGSWNIVGGWVYFRSSFDHGYVLCKMNLNDNVKIKLSEEPVNLINVVGSWVYYTVGSELPGEIYKVRTNENGRADESTRKCLTGGGGSSPIAILEQAIQSGSIEIMMEAVRLFVGNTSPAMLPQLEQQINSIPQSQRKEQLASLLQGWVNDMK